MLIINRNEVVDQMGVDLNSILESESSWSAWFDNSQDIKLIFAQLTYHIEKFNFFEVDYGITTLLKFLQEFIKTKPEDSTVLDGFNDVYQQIHDRFVSQNYTNSNQTGLAIDYITLLKTMMEGDQRYLLAKNEIKIYARNLKEVVTVVSQSSIVDRKFIELYIDTLELSFDSMRFLNAYKEGYEGVIICAKKLFEKKNSEIHPLIKKFFSALAYEVKLLAYYKATLTIPVSIEEAQEEIVQKTVDLQVYFFNKLSTRTDINKNFLKHYFFHEFLKKTAEALLEARCQTDLKDYCNTSFTPLPNKMGCYERLFPSNHTIAIEYANITHDQLTMACQAMACADKRHGQWLARSNIPYTHFNTSIEGSDYIYRIFPDEISYKRDVYAFGNCPSSAGFYTSKGLIAARAQGVGYAMLREDPHSWISVSGHEYAHHLNFVALRDLHRSFNEGLAYVVIHGVCGDGSYISWLQQHIHNLTSLAPLLEGDFIGYNPSFAFMSYLVDTQPINFSALLKLHQAGKTSEFKSTLAELVRTDSGLSQWLQSQLTICSAYPLQDLRVGDCPSISLSDYGNSFITKASRVKTTTVSSVQIFTPTRNPYQLPEPIYQDYLHLMHAINENNTKEISVIAKETRYLRIFNHRDPKRNWETPLHFLFNKYRGNCPPVLVESLLTHGANPEICQQSGITAKQLAKQNCENWPEIKSIFDKFLPKNNSTTPSISTTAFPIENSTIITAEDAVTEVSTWDPWTHSYALAVGFGNGALAGLIDIGIDEGQKRKYLNNRSAQVLHYGLRPAIVTLINLGYTLSAMGPATVVGLAGTPESALVYAVTDYMGAVVGQVISQLVLSRLLTPSKGFTLFFLFSNLGIFLSEGIQLHTLQTLINGLLSSIVPIAGYGATKYLNSMTLKLGEEKDKASASERVRGGGNYSTAGINLNSVLSIARPTTPDSGFDGSIVGSSNASQTEAISLVDVGRCGLVRREMTSSSGMTETSYLINLLEKRLAFFKHLEGYERTAGDDIKKLRGDIARNTGETFFTVLEKIKHILENEQVKECEKSHSEIESAKVIIESLTKRFSLLTLKESRQPVVAISYLNDSLKGGVLRAINDAQGHSEALRNRLENLSRESKGLVSVLFKCLVGLEEALYNANLFAHSASYYEEYKFSEIRDALIPQRSKEANKDLEILLDTREDSKCFKKHLREDLPPLLRVVLSALTVFRAQAIKVKNEKDRLALMNSIASAESSITPIKNQLEIFIARKEVFEAGLKRNVSMPQLEAQPLLEEQDKSMARVNPRRPSKLPLNSSSILFREKSSSKPKKPLKPPKPANIARVPQNNGYSFHQLRFADNINDMRQDPAGCSSFKSSSSLYENTRK